MITVASGGTGMVPSVTERLRRHRPDERLLPRDRALTPRASPAAGYRGMRGPGPGGL